MSGSSENLGGAGIIELTGKIMVVAIVLLLFIVVFVFCLHIYAKYCWYRRRENPDSAARTRRTRLDFAGERQEIAVPRRGLEPSLLRTLPVLTFDPKDFKDGLECAVCLSDISDGEKTRLLPKCNHGFHLECIDMWFESHSTCPLCRNPIKNQNQPKPSGEEEPPSEALAQAPAVDVLIEAPNFPTNVLIWGDETQVSTSAICIEENNSIGTPISITIEPSSSSSIGSTSGTLSPPQIGSSTTVDIHDDNEHKFALATRIRAFKGLLGYNNRRVNPSSAGNLDLEEGGRGQS